MRRAFYDQVDCFRVRRPGTIAKGDKADNISGKPTTRPSGLSGPRAAVLTLIEARLSFPITDGWLEGLPSMRLEHRVLL